MCAQDAALEALPSSWTVQAQAQPRGCCSSVAARRALQGTLGPPPCSPAGRQRRVPGSRRLRGPPAAPELPSACCRERACVRASCCCQVQDCQGEPGRTQVRGAQALEAARQVCVWAHTGPAYCRGLVKRERAKYRKNGGQPPEVLKPMLSDSMFFLGAVTPVLTSQLVTPALLPLLPTLPAAPIGGAPPQACGCECPAALPGRCRQPPRPSPAGPPAAPPPLPRGR